LTAPTGVFGGTFDPIHYGHLRTAFELLQGLRLAEVRFVPCGDPPHRRTTHATADDRLRMVEIAVAGQAGFVTDDRELGREGPSYSIDTLATLRAELPDTPIGLIIGMDAFLGLTGWHRWDELLDAAHIVVAHRPGWKAPEHGALGDLVAERRTRCVEDLHDASHGRIHIQAVTQLEISSSEIRELVAAGQDPRFLMPDAVRDWILDNDIYARTATGK